MWSQILFLLLQVQWVVVARGILLELILSLINIIIAVDNLIFFL